MVSSLRDDDLLLVDIFGHPEGQEKGEEGKGQECHPGLLTPDHSPLCSSLLQRDPTTPCPAANTFEELTHRSSTVSLGIFSADSRRALLLLR